MPEIGEALCPVTLSTIEAMLGELGLPLSSYQRLKAAPDSSTLLETCLLRASLNHLNPDNLPSPESATSSEKILLQRLLIDRGQFKSSLEIFQTLVGELTELPPTLAPWVLYLGAKAHLHQGTLAEAAYLIDQARQMQPGKVLRAYIDLEEIYLLFAREMHPAARQRLGLLFARLQSFDDSTSHEKLTCSAGALLYAFGELSQALQLLEKLADHEAADPLYRCRALLYIFQIRIEQRRLGEARELLPCLIQHFHRSRSEYRASFLRSWMRLELETGGDPRQAEELHAECVRTDEWRTLPSYRVNATLDRATPSRLNEVVALSRLCRQVDDQYSRHYLWLEILFAADGFLPRLSSRGRLRSRLKRYLVAHGLGAEKLKLEALAFRQGDRPVPLAWTDECRTKGHDYLLEGLALQVYLEPEANRVCFSSGERIQLGKDSFTLPLLTLLSRTGGCAPIEQVLRVIYGARKQDHYELERLRLAIYRANKKLARALVRLDSEGVRLREAVAIHLPRV